MELRSSEMNWKKTVTHAFFTAGLAGVLCVAVLAPAADAGDRRSRDYPSADAGDRRSRDYPSADAGDRRSRDYPSADAGERRSRDYPSASDRRSRDYPYGESRGGYGERKKVSSGQEARRMIKEYFSRRDVKIGDVREREIFFEADVRDRRGALVDKVIIDKRTGRIRSTY